MKIEHIAIWTTRLEELKEFYENYFSAKANKKYVNEKKQFESYFLTFPSGGSRLEIMRIPTIQEIDKDKAINYTGYAHFAISVGSRDLVDVLTSELEKNGFTIVDGPRITGDGYYESVVSDPDRNLVEITV